MPSRPLVIFLLVFILAVLAQGWIWRNGPALLSGDGDLWAWSAGIAIIAGFAMALLALLRISYVSTSRRAGRTRRGR